jgi:anaerobic magnesium-protoporphyrin IX monomethyl ester cyclase
MRIVFPYDGYEHLGIGYLGAITRCHGHTVELVPVQIGDYIRGYRRFSDRTLGQSVDAVKSARPDVVAFSLNSFQADPFIRLARALRAQGMRTIAGGPHATAEPETTINSGAFDGLIVREAEAVLDDAVKYVVHRRGPQPMWLSTADRPALIPPPLSDLDALPFPAKELFYEHAPYEAKDYKIIASRGCPFHCVFCAHAPVPGQPPYRKRGIDNIIGELIQARARFHPSTVYFLDDVFTVDRDWLLALMDAYRKRVGMPFHAISHPAHFTPEIADALYHAGCFKIRLGVQSLTPHVKRELGRMEDNTQVAESIAAARRAGMRVETDHMVNIPMETLEEARKEILFYNSHRPDAIKVYWLTPLPGTSWFSLLQKERRLSARMIEEIRQGRGFGTHSYLFHARKEYSDSRWLGIHFLLTFLPFLPRFLVRFLVLIHFDRAIRIPSFLVVVGLSRLLTVMRGGDMVGEGHLRRLWHGGA